MNFFIILIATLVYCGQIVSHSEALNAMLLLKHAKKIKRNYNTSRRAVYLVRSIVTVKEIVTAMLAVNANAIIASKISRLAC